MMRIFFFTFMIFSIWSPTYAQTYDGCGNSYPNIEEAQLNCLRSIDSIERSLILQISSINQDTTNLTNLTSDGFFPVDTKDTHEKIDTLIELLINQSAILSSITDTISSIQLSRPQLSTLIDLDMIHHCNSVEDNKDDCISQKLETISSDFCSIRPKTSPIYQIIPDINQAAVYCMY